MKIEVIFVAVVFFFVGFLATFFIQTAKRSNRKAETTMKREAIHRFDIRQMIAVSVVCLFAGFLTTVFCSVKAYHDGYDAGFQYADDADTEHYERMLREQEEAFNGQIEAYRVHMIEVQNNTLQDHSTECESDMDVYEPSLTDEEIEMLAITIYKEAGGDDICDLCRYRVADVVLNRVEDDRFPDSIEEVLLQKGQYNTFYWDGIVWPEMASNPSEKHAVDRARSVALNVANGIHSDVYGEGYIGQAEMVQGFDWYWHCGICFSKW